MTIVSLLRGINVGGNKLVKMDRLRTVYESLGLRNVRTYLQSGNVIFDADVEPASADIEAAFERAFGFHSDVINRSVGQLRRIAGANPFSEYPDPAKVAVTFLAVAPGPEQRDAIAAVRTDAEELAVGECELYICFHQGMGRSKLPALLGKIMTGTGTTRNWNTVRNLLRLAAG